MNKMSILYFSLRMILGGIFVIASLDKILHPEAFAKIIFNYQILPGGMINITAIVLPWLELILGLLLLAGRFLPGTALWVNILLLIFWVALLFNLARGLDIQCGCFSTTPEESASMSWYVFRDSGFLALGISLWILVARKAPRLAPRGEE